MKSVKLSTYISSKLRVYQFGFPFAIAISLSIFTASLILFIRVTSDQSILRELAPHLSTLVESQDRTELLRLIRSVAQERGSEILLIKNDRIVAASKSLNLLDMPYISEPKLFDFSGSQISKDFIISAKNVFRLGGPNTETSIIINSPLTPIIQMCLLSASIMLIFGFAVSFLFAFQIQKLVQAAIRPIQKIDSQIRDLQNIDRTDHTIESGILEFDAIQATILETQKVIADSRDIKAIAKAREMTAEAYQLLIHDLDVPLSALQQMIATAHTTIDQIDKEKATIAIPKLADQIVSQIKSAKDNLSITVDILSLEDVRECIEDGVLQSQKAMTKDCHVSKNMPPSPVIIAHNSSQLRRAVSNLVSNAMQACRQNVEVTLLERNDKTIIKIEDDGPGISSESVSAFLQGKGTSTKVNRRAYGLASANHIVRLHGGRIIAKKSALGGACFEVHI